MTTELKVKEKIARFEDFVLEKNIFSNIFEKDIRRVFIYKKSERLAKAIHLITPAFADAVSLKNRLDAVAIGLIDAGSTHPSTARVALSRELLTLSSVLSIARTSGILSPMNADLIAHEAQLLLQEVAAYEAPRLFLEEGLTLADIAKRSGRREPQIAAVIPRTPRPAREEISKGLVKDIQKVSERRDAVLSVIGNKPNANIKDISTVIRGVSEKTIQRELQALIEEGVVRKQGERRWSTYSLI